MERTSLRGRIYVIASLLYVVIGFIIVLRSVVAGVLPIGILGLVFIALGVVRLRDVMRREGRT